MNTEENKMTVANSNSDLKRFVMCEFTYHEIANMNVYIPFHVQVRCKLNSHGFKFVDDGNFSAISNENPIPIGKMTRWEDFDSGSVFYKQELDS